MVKITDLKRTAIAGPFNKAAEIYGVDDLVHTKIPRSKNQFTISISSKFTSGELEFHRVAQVSLPDYDFNLQALNQYNRIRYYPTAFRPQPFQIAIYDTRDSEFQFFLQEYSRFYAHNGQGLNVNEETVLRYDTITEDFDRTFGIRAVDMADRYFIDKISITSVDNSNESGRNTRTIDCYNCMINTASHDSLDYSTAAPVMWQVSFSPEHVNISSDTPIGNVSGNRPETSVFERREGNTIFAADSDGNFILDALTGLRQILRIDPIPSSVSVNLSASFSVSFGENGDVLRDESGNPLR